MELIILAIVLGAAFGFALDRVGATNPNYIINMLNLKDLHLMRTILFAIAIAAALLFGSLLLGLIDPSHFSVKESYLGVIIGGGLLGIGFAVAGFCPGTGLGAAATGRKDALWFIAGGLVGAFIYMLVYPAAKASGLLEPILGGKSTLGMIEGVSEASLFSFSGEAIGLVLALVLALVAYKLPKKI